MKRAKNQPRVTKCTYLYQAKCHPGRIKRKIRAPAEKRHRCPPPPLATGHNHNTSSVRTDSTFTLEEESQTFQNLICNQSFQPLWHVLTRIPAAKFSNSNKNSCSTFSIRLNQSCLLRLSFNRHLVKIVTHILIWSTVSKLLLRSIKVLPNL